MSTESTVLSYPLIFFVVAPVLFYESKSLLPKDNKTHYNILIQQLNN